MITKAQLSNARVIVRLDDEFGGLNLNATQTVRQVLNLSIPTAHLVVAGVVTGVIDSSDGINNQAVTEIEETCRQAVAFTTEAHGQGWWNERAAQLL